MKTSLFQLPFIIFTFIAFNTSAQVDSIATNDKYYIITTYNGGEFIGIIITQDSDEILIKTEDRGEITIPKYQIKSIKELRAEDISIDGVYTPDQIFATRYVITTNALPMEKGESYVLFNLYGPEFHYGASEKFGIGLMTTWIGAPLIASAKYSFLELGEKSHFGLGTLLGTGSWLDPSFVIALPYGTLTFGDRKSNINFSGGFGQVWNEGDAGGTALFSIAGITRIGRKVSFVFDTFIVPDISGSSLILIIPGLRFQDKVNKAFQFGFAGLIVDGETIPVPLVQWFRIF